MQGKGLKKAGTYHRLRRSTDFYGEEGWMQHSTGREGAATFRREEDISKGMAAKERQHFSKEDGLDAERSRRSTGY